MYEIIINDRTITKSTQTSIRTIPVHCIGIPVHWLITQENTTAFNISDCFCFAFAFLCLPLLDSCLNSLILVVKLERLQLFNDWRLIDWIAERHIERHSGHRFINCHSNSNVRSTLHLLKWTSFAESKDLCDSYCRLESLS